MNTLHIRSVPDEVYEQLRSLAQARGRSLSAQVVFLLERSLEAEAQQQGQSRLLETIRRRRFTPPPAAPDSTDLLVADRAR